MINYCQYFTIHNKEKFVGHFLYAVYNRSVSEANRPISFDVPAATIHSYQLAKFNLFNLDKHTLLGSRRKENTVKS